jgi:hypothetical protein
MGRAGSNHAVPRQPGGSFSLPGYPVTVFRRAKGTGNEMADVINIIIKNRLVKEKRYINIYHHGTGSSYLISDKNEVNVPLKINRKKDYLTIAVAGEPGHMWNGCRAILPSWLDFDFLATDAVSLNHRPGGERTVITIPPGLPNWQLKITRQKDSLPCRVKELDENSTQLIIISDDDD